jgi:hypothetical protein
MKTKQKNNTLALDGRQSAICHTATNHEQTSAMGGGMEGRCELWRGHGGCNSIDPGAHANVVARSRINQKQKFLASMQYQLKPSDADIGQPLPLMLPGVGRWYHQSRATVAVSNSAMVLFIF